MRGVKPRVALVGYGYWGKALLRNLFSHGGWEVCGVADPDPVAKVAVGNLYPHLTVEKNLSSLLKKQKPHAVLVATPPSTHFSLATQTLEAGCHVLVEKPLGLSSEECEKLIELAKKQNRVLLVDHTFVYHPAVQILKQKVDDGELGDLLYFDSVRVNLGGFQSGTNVLWDLAPHDLSILDCLTNGKLPTEVACVGVKHFDSPVENLCYLHLLYEGKFLAHLHLNWVAPVKIRTVTIGGSQKLVIYDDNLPAEKLKIFNRGVELNRKNATDFRVNYRVGEMVAPSVPNREALSNLIDHFYQCLLGKVAPRSDGESGLRIVRILEAASRSMAAGGKSIPLGEEMMIYKEQKSVA